MTSEQIINYIKIRTQGAEESGAEMVTVDINVAKQLIQMLNAWYKINY